MNLTSFLKSTESLLFRKAFSTFITSVEQNNQILKQGLLIKQTVHYAELADYALVGTAYDYLLRFRLSFLHLRKIDITELVAFNAFNILLHSYSKECKELIKQTANLFEEFDRTQLAILQKYQRTVKLTKQDALKIIHFAITFAKLDKIYRENINPNNQYLTIEYERYSSDLFKLWCNTDMSLFSVKERMLLNPVIGEFSLQGRELITSSDADIIIDNRMIDIKTTSKIDISQFEQVFSYAIMQNLKFKDHIAQIELYFSRYNQLYSIPFLPHQSEIDQLTQLFITCSQK